MHDSQLFPFCIANMWHCLCFRSLCLFPFRRTLFPSCCGWHHHFIYAEDWNRSPWGAPPTVVPQLPQTLLSFLAFSHSNEITTWNHLSFNAVSPSPLSTGSKGLEEYLTHTRYVKVFAKCTLMSDWTQWSHNRFGITTLHLIRTL